MCAGKEPCKTEVAMIKAASEATLITFPMDCQQCTAGDNGKWWQFFKFLGIGAFFGWALLRLSAAEGPDG